MVWITLKGRMFMGKMKNMFGIGAKVLGYKTIGRRTPVNVMISVTNRCQSHCSYCDISTLKQPELNTDEFLKLIDQIVESGGERIALWGGEPLMREDIGQIVRYAKSKGLFVTMDSNGFAVPENLDVVKLLDVLLISFDGRKENHDKNRVPGGFDKVMRAIRAARDVVRIYTITVLTKNNIDDVPFILETAKKEGFSCLFQLLYHNPSEAGDTTSILPTPDEHHRALDQIKEMKKKGYPVVNSTAYLRHLYNWADYSRPTRKGDHKPNEPECLAGRLFCNVDVDGRVYPCNALMKEVAAKNFLDVGFRAAFDACDDDGCRACMSCLNEFNLLLGGNFGAMVNWMRYTLLPGGTGGAGGNTR